MRRHPGAVRFLISKLSGLTPMALGVPWLNYERCYDLLEFSIRHWLGGKAGTEETSVSSRAIASDSILANREGDRRRMRRIVKNLLTPAITVELL
jgi:hypothetical protein